MRLQIISKDCSIKTIEDEDLMLDNIDALLPINEQIVEKEIINEKEAIIIAEYFGIKLEQIRKHLYHVVNTDYIKTNFNWVENNYVFLLELTGKENTMDEYGSILEIINIMSKNNKVNKYWIIRE